MARPSRMDRATSSTLLSRGLGDGRGNEERDGRPRATVRAAETAALPLRISLKLDQVHATLPAVVPAGVWSRPWPPPPATPQEDQTVRTWCLRPRPSQSVPKASQLARRRWGNAPFAGGASVYLPTDRVRERREIAVRAVSERAEALETYAAVFRPARTARFLFVGPRIPSESQLLQLDEPIAGVDHADHPIKQRVKPVQELRPGQAPSPDPNHDRRRPAEQGLVGEVCILGDQDGVVIDRVREITESSADTSPTSATCSARWPRSPMARASAGGN